MSASEDCCSEDEREVFRGCLPLPKSSDQHTSKPSTDGASNSGLSTANFKISGSFELLLGSVSGQTYCAP